MKPMNKATLTWNRGKAEMQSLGAMLAPVDFTLSSGKIVSPLHIAPWSNEPNLEGYPAIIRGLRGEWPCVPFGITPIEVSSDETSPLNKGSEEYPHGYGANHYWDLSSIKPEQIAAQIQYPTKSDIHQLKRTVTGVKDQARLEINLSIKARHDISIPIGLHPTFRLPSTIGGMQLIPSAYDQIWTYPAELEANRLFEGNKCYSNLSAIPAIDGSIIDASRVPFKDKCEEILLLTGIDGKFTLENLEEGYRVVLKWNKNHFPSLMIWISNLGRCEEPWNGRNLCVGIEPICSVFDFGTNVSNKPSIFSKDGNRTALSLKAGQKWKTNYSIEVEPL